MMRDRLVDLLSGLSLPETEPYPGADPKELVKFWDGVVDDLLDAMNDPTPGMIEAMYLAKDLWPNSQCDNRNELMRSFAAPRWRAAIQALRDDK